MAIIITTITTVEDSIIGEGMITTVVVSSTEVVSIIIEAVETCIKTVGKCTEVIMIREDKIVPLVKPIMQIKMVRPDKA